MPAVELHSLGKFGVMSDLPSHELPPEAWSDARNVRFSKRGAERILGHTEVFTGGGGVVGTPEFLLNVIGTTASFWIYTSLTAAHVFEADVHTDITRAAGGTPYTTVNGRDWNGTLLGGIPILNNGIDIPQAWLTLSPGTDLTDITDFVSPTPGTLRAKVIRAFGGYLVALNVTEDGTNFFPQTFVWSHKADPGTLPDSWDYTDPTKDAGRIELTDTKGGDILDARLLGDELIIYKEYSTHALRLVGGNAIFAPRLLLSTSGLLAPRCVAAYQDGTRHFVVTSDDVIIHAGSRESRSIAANRVRDTIFNQIDPTNFVNSFAFENRLQKECWFAYPTIGNTFPNRAAIWNYEDDTWTFRDFTGVSTDVGTFTVGSDLWSTVTNGWDSSISQWATESRVVMIFTDRAKIFQLDSGFQFDTTNPDVFLERTGLAIDGKDRQGQPKASFTSRKLAHRIWPKVSGSSIINIRLGKQELMGGVVTFDALQPFDASTQKFLDSSAVPVNGLLLAIRYETSDDMPWTLEGHDLYVERLGDL